MKIFKHRCNTAVDLDATPRGFGIEVDIRTWRDTLVTEHDPFVEGNSFTDWIASYNHAGLILNVKEEGLEEALINLLTERNILDYLFLDQSYPFMIKWLRAGFGRHIAARVSEYESIFSLESLPYIPKFVWCDSFSGNWEHLVSTAQFAADNDSTVIIVSPELHQRKPNLEVNHILERGSTLSSVNLAVCTKDPSLWI